MSNQKVPKVNDSILIIGSGVFGIGIATELKKRGFTNVTVVDETVRGNNKETGKPNPIASSTDISKVVRSDYGKDEVYTTLNDDALAKWDSLNKKWGENIYHEDGLLVSETTETMSSGFPADAFQLLKRMGYPVQKVDRNWIQKTFPQISSLAKSGYFNRRAGWAESGRALGKFIEEAESLGVQFTKGLVKELIRDEFSVKGAILSDGSKITADWTIVATGAWTPFLVPELKEVMIPTAQPVFHFKPKNPQQFEAPNFPVYFPDPVRSGFYVFPLHPKEKVVKIAFHSEGYPMSERMTKENLEKKMNESLKVEEERIRKFIESYLPDLKDAPIVYKRMCMYCDSFDGDFFIDHSPSTSGLFVAAGGSGHGFKFSPIIGKLIADIFERKPNKFAYRFVWRLPNTQQQRHYDVLRHTNSKERARL